ncbi:MAG: TSUP family transporter [Solirubrobacteraceae bacterium]
MADVALVVMAAFAALVQTAVGMGFALVLSPVLLIALTPKAAVVTVTALGLTVNLVTVLRGGRALKVNWEEVTPILIAAVPGSLGGLALLELLSKPAIETGVGVMVVALALLRVSNVRVNLRAPVAAMRLAVGLLAGVLSTASGINGPPLALWLSGRALEATVIRDSLAAIFLGAGLITAITLLPSIGGLRLSLPLFGAALLAVLIGQVAGHHVHLRASEDQLRRALGVVIMATGIAALLSGLGVL